MKKWIITGVILTLVGLLLFAVAMTLNGWDFDLLSTAKYQTNEYEISERFSKISIDTDTANVVLLPSEDGVCRVKCYDEVKIAHTVSVEDGNLSIVAVNEKNWYDNVVIDFATACVTVYLPKGEYESLFVKTGTGDVKIEDLDIDGISIEVSTGDVILSDMSCAGEVSIKLSTGDAFLENVTAKRFSSIGNTGDITLDKVIATENIFINRSTGDVHLVRCDSENIFVKTSTGDVKGSILTKKVFLTDTSTGDIDVPKTDEGGRCEIITSTGDIKLTVLS